MGGGLGKLKHKVPESLQGGNKAGRKASNKAPQQRRWSMKNIPSPFGAKLVKSDALPSPGVVPDPEPAVETPRERPRRASMPLTEEEVRKVRMLMKGKAGTDAQIRHGKELPEEATEQLATHAATMKDLGSVHRRRPTSEELEEETEREKKAEKRRERRASLAAVEQQNAAKEYCSKCSYAFPRDCVCVAEAKKKQQREEDAEFVRQLRLHVVPVVHDNRTLTKYAEEIEKDPAYQMELDAGGFGKKKQEKAARKEKRAEARREFAEQTLVDEYIDRIGDAITGKNKKKDHVAKRLHLCTHKMG
mmetsp:Transcript_12685/g.31898  ORF Transcript_12685/g.31898 Transcript_12685/m.31898 type:complete len:304 (+) Transcript_12685:156-1067(+)